MMSGIGDASVLEGLNITAKKHLPRVGMNLQDHPVLGVTFESPSPLAFDLQYVVDGVFCFKQGQLVGGADELNLFSLFDNLQSRAGAVLQSKGRQGEERLELRTDGLGWDQRRRVPYPAGVHNTGDPAHVLSEKVGAAHLRELGVEPYNGDSLHRCAPHSASEEPDRSRSKTLQQRRRAHSPNRFRGARRHSRGAPPRRRCVEVVVGCRSCS